MNWIDKLWRAVRTDRYLQLALAAFFIVSIGAISDRSRPASIESDRTQVNRIDMSPFGQDAREPFVFELPADQATVRQSALALLSGRTVLMKDENGQWRRMDPPVDANGEVKDHSQTMLALAKLGCTDNRLESSKLILETFTEEQRRLLCETQALLEQ